MQGIRVGAAVALGCLVANVALAQPGQQYAPPAYAYQPRPQVQLTQEEAELLQDGIIDDGQIILGGLGAIFVGFGLGQAIEGRWSDTGWIFTAGEIAAMTVAIVGIAQCGDHVVHSNDDFDHGGFCEEHGAGKFIVGLLAFAGLRVWETVDAFVGPASHNRRVRAVQARVYGGYPPPYSFYVKPTMSNEGTVAGLSFSF